LTINFHYGMKVNQRRGRLGGMLDALSRAALCVNIGQWLNRLQQQAIYLTTFTVSNLYNIFYLIYARHVRLLVSCRVHEITHFYLTRPSITP
jgi:hypothetical protein